MNDHESPAISPISSPISIQLHMRQDETMDGLGLCGVVEALSALVVAFPMPSFDRCCCSFGEPLLCSSQHSFLRLPTHASCLGDHLMRLTRRALTQSWKTLAAKTSCPRRLPPLPPSATSPCPDAETARSVSPGHCQRHEAYHETGLGLCEAPAPAAAF